MYQSDSGVENEEEARLSLGKSLSLADIGAALRRSAGFIVMAIVSCEIIAVSYLMVSSPRYPTEMLLAPQQAGGNQGGGGLSGALSRLTSFTGTSDLLGMSSDASGSEFEKFQVLYNSAQTAEFVDRRLHLSENIFPGWNARTERWEMPPLSISNAPQRLVRWLFGRPVWREPTPADLAAVLGSEITIAKRDTDPFLSVSSVSRDPKVTEALMLALTQAANEILRQRAQQQGVVLIDYLSHQLDTVSNADHRQVLINLLSAQEQNLMLSRSKIPYAAQIVTPPTTHFDQPKPGVALTITLAGLVGVVGGILIALFREATGRFQQQIPEDSIAVFRNWMRKRPEAG
jgi:hypothetical protein